MADQDDRHQPAKSFDAEEKSFRAHVGGTCCHAYKLRLAIPLHGTDIQIPTALGLMVTDVHDPPDASRVE